MLMGFTYFARHKAMLYVGRIFTGLMNGAATPASQIYVNYFLLLCDGASDVFFHRRLASVLPRVFEAHSARLPPVHWL